MNEEFKNFLNGGYKGISQVRSNFPEEYKIIEDHNKNFKDISWGQKLYNYVNNISHPPKCVCGNEVNFHKFGKGYKIYCSTSCMYKDENMKNKKKEAYIKKYGVDNPLKSQEIQDKRRDLYIEKYGVEHHSQLPDVIEKKKQTNLKKYGTTTNLLHEDTIEKSKKTKLERYGVDHQSKSEVIKEKKRQTNLKNWGYECNLQSPELRKNREKNDNKKYLKKISELTGHDLDKLKIINDNVVFIDYCKKHKEFIISKHNFYSRFISYKHKNFCTECFPINEYLSIREQELKNFLKKVNVDFIENTKKIIYPLELDVFIPEHQLGIEFNGLYWHSYLSKGKEYHLKKTELCEEKGIQLLHVFESDWLHKREIVKSLIGSKLNIYDLQIDVVNCKIKDVDNDVTKEFLNNNHIQGYVKSLYNIGLFYDNELVSLISFGEKDDGEFEIFRFCDKINTKVLDGRKGLINHIIEKYNPREITTSVDRRYFNGDMYKQLGFEIKGYNEPDYWYYNKNELKSHHKSHSTKEILIEEGYDPDKSEFEIMEKRGYYRIYDCGTINFKLSLVK